MALALLAAPARAQVDEEVDEAGLDWQADTEGDPALDELKIAVELEAAFLQERQDRSAPAGVGAWARYDDALDEATDGPTGWRPPLPLAGLDPDPGGLPDKPVVPTALLSFDPSAITDIPFGLDRIDDPALLEFLEFYHTTGRTRAVQWIARAGRYRSMIEAIAREEGAPTELVWVAAIESGFSFTARSRAGAVGMWQFMRPTGQQEGLTIDRQVDERMDPVRSTRAALRYLSHLYDTFHAWPLALAAYNAGGGHVRSEVRAHNTTDFWTMDAYGCVYTSARRYALRAIALAILDRNRAVFGLEELVADPPWHFDEVEVPGGVRLSLVAQAAGVSLREVQDLNPALRLGTTPTGRPWPVRLPPGTADLFVRTYDDVARRWGTEHTEALVLFGETLTQLADAYGVPVRVLRVTNGLGAGEEPPYGSLVLIPGGMRLRQPPALPTTPLPVVVPSTRFEPAGRQRIWYQVHNRDTLWAIADHFGVSVWDLAAWNDLDPAASIFTGHVLQLFVSADADLTRARWLPDEAVTAVPVGSAAWEALRASTQPGAGGRVRRYTVRSGDTLSRIASRHGVRVQDLTRLNRISATAPLRPGQVLILSRQ
jgi:membrane-bound lytic murein transglycosylase D